MAVNFYNFDRHFAIYLLYLEKRISLVLTMQKRTLILVGVIVVLALVGVAILGSRQGAIQEPSGIEPVAGPALPPSEEQDVDSVEVVEDGGLPAQATLATDEELQRLQEFLDANDNVAIVEQAAFLIDSEDALRREEAIDALTWVSTPQAGRVLLPSLRHPDPATAEQALSSLTHILNTLGTQIVEDPESGELLASDEGGLSVEGLEQTFDLWVDAGKSVGSVDDLETLLIPLSGMDVKFAVPVLVELTEGLSGPMREKAAEYLDMATNSSGVTNREEAALWLQQQ